MGQTIPISNCHNPAPMIKETSSNQLFITPPKSYVKSDDPSAIANLLYAASNGDAAGVEKLVTRGVHVNGKDYDKRSALHVAAADGHFDIVQVLLNHGADANSKDRWGCTPLDDAMRGSHHDVTAALRAAGGQSGDTPRTQERTNQTTISENAPLEVADTVDDGMDFVNPSTKLCAAAAAGSLGRLQALAKEYPDVNAADYDGRTALHVASSYGNIDMIMFLLDMKANVNCRDNFGLTPLTSATASGKDSAAQVLLSKGALSIDIQALQLSSTAGHWAIPVHEVEMGKVINRTLKSVIYQAKWRGTKVVAKTSVSLTKKLSNSNFAELFALQEDSEEYDSVDLKSASDEMMHEIHLLSTFRHPDLVMFLGACLNTEPCFFVTEFMEGGDLQHYFITQSKRLQHRYRPPWPTFLKWANAIARALCFLHNCHRPIIHRDLKPLNLLLTANQDLKVTDFGISKLMSPKAHGKSREDPNAAPYMSGGIGTWRYMAPEVVRYEQYTDRVDIYSFALIVWFMGTGMEPFADQFNDPELVLKEYIKGNEPRPNAAAACSHFGRHASTVRQFIEDCWHTTPSKRPSAQECTDRLADLCAAPSPARSMSAVTNSFKKFVRQRT